MSKIVHFPISQAAANTRTGAPRCLPNLHPEALSELPFIGDADNGRCFWDVQSTGDFCEDVDLGAQYGFIAVRQLRQTNCRSLLGWIAIEMARRETARGLIVGFMWAVSRCLTEQSLN